jgi:hypothetical protein
MAKGLPYFKFTPSEWLTGDICFEDLETQGLFINICAWYWQRDGNLTISDIEKRYNKPTALSSLSNRFLNVENGIIKIVFLDEQLEERKHISKTNSENGSKGGRPKTLEEKPTAFISVSEIKPTENPIRKEEEKKKKRKESVIPSFLDFYEYAKTLDGFHEQLEKPIKTKYDSWVANDWKDGKDNKITNWKSKLINTMPYIVTANPPTRSTFKYPFPR